MKAEQTTSTATLTGEQAIFTSIRTPMGEGYRIIAASRGLKQDEKQVITRSSPSHDSLCWGPNDYEGATDKLAAAFYTLPSGRFCAALCRYAGEEHTGRGGHRVYTHNVVFEPADFSVCQFNPFVVLRAMVANEMNEPQLKPPPVLPELQLELDLGASVDASDDARCESDLAELDDGELDLWGTFAAPWRRYVLHSLLDGRSLIINLPEGWTERAEAILLGIPGPMRAKASFGAGLKYSVGRGHQLSVLFDHQGISKTRSAGRKVEFVDPDGSETAPDAPSGEWITFVERYWSRSDLGGLAKRTSRAFPDHGRSALEQLGRLYNQMDALAEAEIGRVVDMVTQHLEGGVDAADADASREFVSTAQRALTERLVTKSWTDVQRHWPAVCSVPQSSEAAQQFLGPVVEAALLLASRVHPAVAAEAALQLSQSFASNKTDLPASILASINTALNRFADWVGSAGEAQRSQCHGTAQPVDAIVDQWRRLRPNCPIVRRMLQRCSATAAR